MNQRLKTLKACYSSLLIGVLGVVLCLTSAGSYLEEEWGLAWLFKLRGTTVAPHEVVIVNIDKNSAESLQLPENPEKWSRAYYAQLIDKINKNNAAIIAFNIFFGEAHDPDNDGRMANMMVAGKNVVLSNYLKQYIPPNSE
ncbi:MAG: CHASE2 domain-containing protein, partial [Methylococcaceae bacterium]|nr:CHASE2 domain-containing protein [Methylococcaceae bacterium]